MAEVEKEQIPEVNFEVSEQDISMAMSNAVAQENAQIEQNLAQDDIFSNALNELDKYTLPATGEMRPFFADGTSPDTPINESPLSGADRLKINLGNKKGSINYLKQNFEDAALDAKGNIIVKDNGLWKRADAEGLGTGDAWTRTKELLKDVVDISPEAATVAATIPTAGLGTVAAVAASETVRTSLGRLAGTYEASAEEQLQDIGVESLLALGGVGIAAGVKPAAGMLKKGLGGLAKTMGKASIGTRNAWANVLGPISGAGAENVHRAFERGSQVGNLLDDAIKQGRNAEGAIGILTNKQVSQVSNMALNSRKALTQYYDDLMKPVLGKVGNNFAAAADDIAKPISDAYKQAGILVQNKAGKLTVPSQQALIPALEASGDDMLIAAAADISVDPKNYRIFKSYIEAVANAPKASQRGVNGFKNLRAFQRGMESRANQFMSTKDIGPGIQQFLKGSKKALDANFQNTIQAKLPANVAKDFIKINETYRTTSQQLRPLLDLNGKIISKGRSAVSNEAQTVLNQLMSGAGKNAATKSAVDTAIASLSKTAAGKGFQQAYDTMLDMEAAKAFSPAIRNSFIQFGAPVAAAGSLASGSVSPAVGTAATLAGTSPRAIFRGIQGVQAFKQGFNNLPKAQVQNIVKSSYLPMAKIREIAMKGQNKLLDDRSLNILAQTAAQAINGQ